jgi:hypothetical protein
MATPFFTPDRIVLVSLGVFYGINPTRRSFPALFNVPGSKFKVWAKDVEP